MISTYSETRNPKSDLVGILIVCELDFTRKHISMNVRGKQEPGTMGLGNMLVALSIPHVHTLTASKGQHLLHELCDTVPRAHAGAHGLLPVGRLPGGVHRDHCS